MPKELSDGAVDRPILVEAESPVPEVLSFAS